MNRPKININHICFRSFGFLLFAIFISNQYCFSQSESKNGLNQSIKGKLQLDSIWKPVVYLSHIPSFTDMYTMSNEIIIADAKVDSSGYFYLSTESLPKQDNLYRLHLSKKASPAASLIIGGKEENHIFLIANKNSSITINNATKDSLFYNYNINGYQPNIDFKTVHDIINNDNISAIKGNLKKEFINKTIYEELRNIADTASHPIVSLYALTNSKFESSYLENQKFYESYLEKWKSENSSYFNELRSKFPKENTNSTFWIVTSAIFFFLLGYVINYIVGSRRKKANKQLKLLSVQERKIYSLLVEGKSNKEISEEFNIGVSTVKSHVSSIYNKLNIKSRKDIVSLNNM
ncbi:response regulator transcription factor [Winogradskyella luteola]|uniref:Helix-turn-helix transcriptional regulator n=1 Tax=Winogradskyella luteola TaxID=2828330 RepID=A0A9X1F7L7_9FLAO|nr:helix-turn-helix transcriptional regulator [Winogradskyella luteola]MBV7268611.1 helix-turn-helix transcriptional regulator [Winogradskyella luteola]